MSNPILRLGAVYFGLNAALMWALPQLWYQLTPGVAAMGPFNLHFIRDIALAMAVSGAAFWAAAVQGNRSLALFACGWPLLHALFHIWIWAMHRGAALDLIAGVNLLGIQAPAWATFWAAMRLHKQEVLA